MKQMQKKSTNRALRCVLSLALVLAMLLSVVPGGLGVLTAEAADGDVYINIHFYSEPSWNWEQVAIQYWGGSNTVVSNDASGPTEISGWGGAQGYVMNSEGSGWYTITLKGDFEGFQFLDMSAPGNNTGGKGYDSYMSQFTGSTATDLYCKYNADTGYKTKWYTDKDCTQELSAPADATTYTYKIHFNDTKSWGAVNAYAWGGVDLGQWSGTAMTANANNDGWYDITVSSTSDSFSLIFNGGDTQTNDLTASASGTETELWYTLTTQSDGKWNASYTTTAPEGWDDGGDATTYTYNLHFQNSQNWTDVKTYAWDASDETFLGAWGGTAMTANASNTGWYDLKVETTNSAFSLIFNGVGGQTEDLSLAMPSGSASTELWYTLGTKNTDKWNATASSTAPDGWNSGSVTTSDYYLIGYINNVDLGCEADASNTGPYKFVDGKLTVTFDTTSYVFVKTGDNSAWYMTDGWLGSVTEAKLYKTEGSHAFSRDPNKLMVPSGVELTFTLVKNSDDSVTLSYVDNSLNDPSIPSFNVVDGVIKVGDLVQVKVGSSVYDMDVYGSGVYEATANVIGDASAELYVNGVTTGKTCQITGADGDTVIRVTNGATLDAVKLETVDVGSITWVGTLSGITDGAISDWTPSDTDGDLDYLGGGLYGKTFSVSAAADTDVEFKVAFNGTWDESIGESGYNGTNRAVTIPAGTTEVTILVDKLNNVMYDSITAGNINIVQNSGSLKSGALDTTVSLIGTVRGGNDDWVAGATGWDFEQISSNIYRYQMDLAAGSYNYKCVFNHANWYEKEGDQSLKLAEDTHVVFVYNAATGYLYDSVNDPDTVATLMGMTARASILDNKDGTVRVFLPDAGYGSVTLNWADTADVEEGASLKTTAMTQGTYGGWYATIDVGDGPVDIAYYFTADGSSFISGDLDTTTVDEVDYNHFSRDALPVAEAYVPGTFPGESWNPASNKMTYLGDGIYSYTFENVPAANYEFKIAINGSWDENYGKGGVKNSASDNYSVTVPTAQDVTVYYSHNSHLAVTSVEYIFADIDLEGTGIPAGTKLTDNDLTTIYSVALEMEPGTYDDVKIVYNGKDYPFAEFTLDAKTTVTFYMDPVTEIYYCDAPGAELVADLIYYNSQDEAYKSPYGAVATGEDVTFHIDTCPNADAVYLVTKGTSKQKVEFTKDGEVENGVQKWAATTSFDTIGENDYYFVIYNDNTALVYGDDDGYYGEGKVTNLSDVLPYDLVVYEAGFETPDWMKDAVIYQIFPDRFYDGDESNNQAQLSARGAVDYEFVEDWYTWPENPEQEGNAGYPANALSGDGEWSNEIYGGDLQGIIDRIDYLKALGVNVIYLNPVFSSISNHRYDACDYTVIDPILGTEGDFAELVAVAEANDMHIILDGVFNHVSDDSIYFDRYYKFLGQSEKIGAYPYWAYVYDYMADNAADQETAEAAAKEYFTDEYGITDYSYTEWFKVYNSFMSDGTDAVTDSIGLRAGEPVYSYDGWWGYDSMPIIYSTNGSEYQTGNWAEEIIGNEDGTSVTQYWISEGSNGWRLDVANEVSDETWQNFRASVKALDSDAVIVGEIWDDATKYILGDMYDSVMNYMFRSAVTNFAKGASAEDTTKAMEKLRERYPEEAFYAMMNLVGSHDTTRILSYLDGIPDDRSGATMATAFPTYETTSDTAKQRQYLVSFLQFTYAGAPTIYYGDEIGMVGADDPDDRRAMEWGRGNQELVEWYAKLAAIRSEYSALRTGAVAAVDTGSTNVLGYVRSDDANELIVLANNSSSAKSVILNLDDLGVECTKYTGLLDLDYEVDGTNGTVTVFVPAYSGVILVKTENAEEVTVDSDALAPAYNSAYTVGARHMHDYELTKVVDPTCTEEGYTLYTCADDDCGETTKQNIKKATGHDWGEWTVTTPATATTTGEERRDCNDCDAYETRPIPTTGSDTTTDPTSGTTAPTTGTSDPTKPTEKPNQPATGDGMPVVALGMMLLASILCATALVFSRKKWMQK